MGELLTEDQIAAYHRDGFLVVPDFVSGEECRRLKARAEQILHDFDPDAHRSVFTTNEQSRHADREFLESPLGVEGLLFEEAVDAGASPER